MDHELFGEEKTSPGVTALPEVSVAWKADHEAEKIVLWEDDRARLVAAIRLRAGRIPHLDLAAIGGAAELLALADDLESGRPLEDPRR